MKNSNNEYWNSLKIDCNVKDYHLCNDDELFNAIRINYKIINSGPESGSFSEMTVDLAIVANIYCGKILLDRYPNIPVKQLITYLELKNDINTI